MAINKRFTTTKGVLEINAVTFQRTGNLMAMYPLAADVTAENGMVLGVDYTAQEITYPSATSDALMLHFSSEKEYDAQNVGLNKFYLTKDSGYYPRLGKLEVNDRFTTSAVSYDSAVFADLAAIRTAVAAGTVYAKACETEGYKGLIELVSTTAPTAKVVLKAVDVTTVPNGEPAIKFVVIESK